MEYLRYLLFCYVLLGLLVTGGVLFNRKESANFFLAAFTLLFTLEQLDFLYVTSAVFPSMKQFYMLLFPICLLFGPSFYFYIKYLRSSEAIRWSACLPHLIPFFCYLVYTVFLFTFSPTDRVEYVQTQYAKVVMPLNYIKAVHVILYGFAAIQLLSEEWPAERRVHAKALVLIYGFTALLQAILTVFAKDYSTFVFYFVSASSLVLFIAYLLYCQPTFFEQLRTKYLHSNLSYADKKRIADKILHFVADKERLLQRHLSLKFMCEAIGEQKHHVSQTLSEEFKASFNDLINFHRVEYAKTLLKDPAQDHHKILAIALESGFTNKNTFHRSFTKYTNQTPGAYRLQNR